MFLSLLFYDRSTRMHDLSFNLSRTYDTVRPYLVPASTCLCHVFAVVLSTLSVRCCVSYPHSQTTVVSDSTKHTLERESPVTRMDYTTATNKYSEESS